MRRIVKLCLLLLVLVFAVWVPRSITFSQSPAPSCQSQPLVEHLLGRTSLYAWADWIHKLSGERAVSVGGQKTYIQTRLTEAIVSNQPNALAIPFVLEQLQNWYPEERIAVEEFQFQDNATVQMTRGENIILTLPGSTHSSEMILLVAHLDSTSKAPFQRAPGADDNATGSAALLEAARLLRNYRFDRTLQLIWFTGEEQGLKGSKAYVEAHPDLDITGVINLDMIGYDSDNDRCFEIHVGDLPASDAVGQCLLQSIQSYRLDLRYDYLIGSLGEGFSDQASFWDAKIGAIGLIENVLSNQVPNGCGSSDFNVKYHQSADQVGLLNLSTGFSIVKASLAAIAGLAGPIDFCFDSTPAVQKQVQSNQVNLSWQRMPGASAYRVLASTESCSGPWESAEETSAQSWKGTVSDGRFHFYRVEAIAPEGTCSSLPSRCQVIFPGR